MATKKEITNFTTSQELKVAMLSKGIDVSPMPEQVVYDGSANDQHLIIADTSDGSYRTINQVSGNVSFDFVDSTDPALVRAWSKRELDVLISIYPGIEFSDYITNGGTPVTYTHTVRYNGINYSATNQNLPNAMAKAFIKVLEL